jgi:hypothetical protein
LLKASRSSKEIARLTTCWRFLIRRATNESVDKDVRTPKVVVVEGCGLVKISGKLSMSGNGKGISAL